MTPNQMLTEKIAALASNAKVQLNRRGISLDGTETMTDAQVAELEAIGMKIGMSRRTGWLELKADMSELDPKLQVFLQSCQEEADEKRATLPVVETTAEGWMRERNAAKAAEATEEETDEPKYEDADEDGIFGRVDIEGNVKILRKLNGAAVTSMELWSGIYPIGSRLSCAYHHPQGIVLARKHAEELEIEIEE